MKIGEKLKIARQQKNLTREFVAAALEVNLSTVSRYETDKMKPPLDKLEALAKLYNVPLTYLVTDSEDSESSMKQWISSLSPAELQALQEFISQQLQDNQ